VLLALLSAAWAHTPHDFVRGAAPHPDDPSQIVALLRIHEWYTSASTDGGGGFSTLLFDDPGEGLRDVAWVGDALLVTAAGVGLFASPDGGATFAPLDGAPEGIDGEVLALSPDGRWLFAGDDGGIWRGEVGGGWALEDGPRGRVVDVAFAPSAAGEDWADDPAACLTTDQGAI